MGEMSSEEGQGSVQEPDDTQGQLEEGTSINPAWNDLLGVVPEMLHSQITPYLQQWDKNYQDGIGKVHSQYESYKPYLENGIQPDQINYGLQLLDAVENRPEEVLQALQNFYGQTNEQPQEQGLSSEPVDENGDPILSHPEFQRVNEMVNTMAKLLVQQNSERQTQEEDQRLETEFSAAREKHGEFDENWVTAQILANPQLTVDQAASQYKEFVQGILAQNNRPGPRVIGSGGTTPNPGVSPSELDDKGRRSLVAQMLEASRQQGQ